MAELDAVFAAKSVDEWAEIFDRHDVWWVPVNSMNEVVDDTVARAAGAFVEVPWPDGPTPTLATPADFSDTPQALRGAVPELGQHTEEGAPELGHDWDRIAALKENGAII